MKAFVITALILVLSYLFFGDKGLIVTWLSLIGSAVLGLSFAIFRELKK